MLAHDRNYCITIVLINIQLINVIKMCSRISGENVELDFIQSVENTLSDQVG